MSILIVNPDVIPNEFKKIIQDCLVTLFFNQVWYNVNEYGYMHGHVIHGIFLYVLIIFLPLVLSNIV